MNHLRKGLRPVIGSDSFTHISEDGPASISDYPCGQGIGEGGWRDIRSKEAMKAEREGSEKVSREW